MAIGPAIIIATTTREAEACAFVKNDRTIAVANFKMEAAGTARGSKGNEIID